MNSEVKKYLSAIGTKGGRRSRRTLDPETAKRMVLVREAKKAFLKFHPTCFWSSPRDMNISVDDLDWVSERLRTYGGREGWALGAKLCP